MRATNNNGASAPGWAASGRNLGHKADGASASRNEGHNAALTRRDRLRGCIKNVIVNAACWGFPASWAQWLVRRGGLRDA